jgi:hypothetical protein
MQWKFLNLNWILNSILHSKLNTETLITFYIIMKHKMYFNVLISHIKELWYKLQRSNQIIPVIKDFANAINDYLLKIFDTLLNMGKLK